MDARDDGPVSPIQMSPQRARGVGVDEEVGYEAYRGQALGVAR